MRIGHYAPTLWAPGGIATWVSRLGQAQAARGSDVFYLTGSRMPDEPHPTGHVPTVDSLFKSARDLGLDVLHLHKEVPSIPDRSIRVLRTMHGNQASCPSGSRFLEKRGRPCNRVAGVLACSWGHVVDRCGSVRPNAVRGHIDRFQAERRVLPNLLTHTVSEFLRSRMIEAGYDGSRIVTVLSPAPVKDAEPPPPPRNGIPRFVFLGRVVPAKGARWLLRAMVRSRETFEVDIAGDGYELADLKRFASENGLADRVTFHGWLGGDAVDALVRDSRAVVFPSIWHEPAGLVTLEAAAAGRAVVAGRVGGIPEYADKRFAELVNPGNVQEMADALDALARDYDRAARLGASGRTFVREHFAMHDFVDRIDQLYNAA